jgi:hypothetical protein
MGHSASELLYGIMGLEGELLEKIGIDKTKSYTTNRIKQIIQVSREKIGPIIQSNDPVTTFANNCIVTNPKGRVLKSELYLAYSRFCDSKGFTKAKEKVFIEELKEIIPLKEDIRKNKDSGIKPSFLHGINLRKGNTFQCLDCKWCEKYFKAVKKVKKEEGLI